ncbi:uncharacterized protein [Pocillopora verrucosa]|uniref:uncharacterized protein isoform X2 n=1 Tax=Pocillopora verrucosa TaxID=203993 RepID=UPI003340E0EA
MATSYLLPLGARPKEHSSVQEVTLTSNPFHVWRVWSFKRLLLKLKVRRFSEKHFSSRMTGFWSVSDDDHHLQTFFFPGPIITSFGSRPSTFAARIEGSLHCVYV